MTTTLKECGDLGIIEDEKNEDQKKRKDGVYETINTINTIATGSELVSNGDNKNGFFSDNVKTILKSKLNIEKAIEKISS